MLHSWFVISLLKFSTNVLEWELTTTTFVNEKRPDTNCSLYNLMNFWTMAIYNSIYLQIQYVPREEGDKILNFFTCPNKSIAKTVYECKGITKSAFVCTRIICFGSLHVFGVLYTVFLVPTQQILFKCQKLICKILFCFLLTLNYVFDI